MTRFELGTPLGTKAARPSSVSWFVWVTVGGSAITLVQLLAGGATVPLSVAFAAALAFQALILFARRPSDFSAPVGLASAICAMLGGAFVAIVHAVISESNNGDLFTSFLFMYSLGLAMIVFVAGPATVRLTRSMKVLIVAAFTLGLAQALSNNLLLPQSFKDEFGILYENFINDRTRVLSFFASAPRFAELTVFVLIYTVFGMIQGTRRTVIRSGATVLLLYLLYNTFSRSGYLLFATSLIFLLLYCHSTLSKRWDGRPSLAYHGILLVLLLGALCFAFAPSVKELAITDSTSLESRHSHWNELKDQFVAEGAGAYLFGTGRSAHANILQAEHFVIDNVFYAFVYFGGIVALGTVVCLYWRTLRALLRARTKHPEAIPLAALISALPVEGLFLDNHNTLLITLFMAIGGLNRYAHEESARSHSHASRSHQELWHRLHRENSGPDPRSRKR
ncbi:hypothetical protein ACFRCW_18100 [Streptomyces sp. NPDC056653]|uniref:hypothetical protein n=1 Tax=Streptomyces sp. NPDC056653 TaxID=3345894 RepID=UPI00368622A9